METFYNISLCFPDIFYNYEIRDCIYFMWNIVYTDIKYLACPILLCYNLYFARRVFCYEAVDKTWKKKDGDFSGATFC